MRPAAPGTEGLHTIQLLFLYPKVEKITKTEQTISAGRELQVRGRTEKQKHHSARTRIRWDGPELTFHP